MSRVIALLMAGLVCHVGRLPAQGYRLRLDTRMQGVSWRGLSSDSIPIGAAIVGPTGGVLTPDGHAATCDERFCFFFRPGSTLRGVPLVSQADLTAWGFGVSGLRLRVNARYTADLGESTQFPGTEPDVQLVEGYLEYARRQFTVQAGRQYLPGRLGAYGLDGARAGWRQGATGFDVAAYGGWGLARGSTLPVTSPELNPLADFQPRDRQIVAGAELGWSAPGVDLRSEYRREVDPATDFFVSERVAGSLALRPLDRVTITGGGIYDLAFGQWGTADAALTWMAPWATLSVGGRRYRPFFDLWTIWGAFSPVPFHAYHGAVTTSPLPGLVLRARGERYEFEDTETSTPLVDVKDRGWRFEGGATWEPVRAWTIGVGHQVEVGPGAQSRGVDGRVDWRPAEPFTLGVHAASIRRPLELRFSDAHLTVYGADAEWQPNLRWRFGLGLTRIEEERDRPDAGALDWNQMRFVARVTLFHGTEIDRPRLPRAIRSGGTP